jgi:DnaK suppressor protein
MTKEQLLAMSADDYMNADQLAFFTGLLQAMKVETHERIELSRATIESLDTPSDPADVASVEEERHWLVNAIERSWKWPWAVSLTKALAGATTAVNRSACSAC